MLTEQHAIPSMLAYFPEDWPDVRAQRTASDGAYLILGVRRREHRLWLPGPPAHGAAVSALLPVDQSTTARAAATLRLLRHLKKSSAPATQIDDRRILMTLRALDGHLDRASYHDIAEQLFGHERLEADPWKTSSIRAMTIRLVKSGLALMRGGYRKLLRK